MGLKARQRLYSQSKGAILIYNIEEIWFTKGEAELVGQVLINLYLAEVGLDPVSGIPINGIKKEYDSEKDIERTLVIINIIDAVIAHIEEEKGDALGEFLYSLQNFLQEERRFLLIQYLDF